MGRAREDFGDVLVGGTAQIKELVLGGDPRNGTDGTAVSAGTVASQIWVSPDGSDTAGDGTLLAPYASLTAAMAAVTAARKTVLVFPGTYTEEDTVDWPLISGVQLIGLGPKYSTVIGTDSGDEVISIAPGVQTATFELWIVNIYIDHATTGLDGIVFDNTSMAKKLNAYIERVGFDADSDSDRSILVTHGDLANAVRLYMDGENGDVSGLIEWSAHNDGDRLHCRGMNLDGGITMGATAVATDVKLIDCRVKHAGVIGGHASTVVQAKGCWTDEAGTIAALDGDDIAGSITGEVII